MRYNYKIRKSKKGLAKKTFVENGGAEEEFIAQPSGVEEEFKSLMAAIKKDTKLVVFETLYCNGVELTAHADINDDGQTVTIKPYIPHNPKTGDERNIGTWIGLGGVGLGAAVAVLVLKLKMKKDEDK